MEPGHPKWYLYRPGQATAEGQDAFTVPQGHLMVVMQMGVELETPPGIVRWEVPILTPTGVVLRPLTHAQLAEVEASRGACLLLVRSVVDYGEGFVLPAGYSLHAPLSEPRSSSVRQLEFEVRLAPLPSPAP